LRDFVFPTSYTCAACLGPPTGLSGFVPAS